MSSIPTTFDLNVLTQTAAPLPGIALESQVSSLVSAATQLPGINTDKFLTKDQSTSFYQSSYYRQTISDKNPPAYSSYAKDPTGAEDDSYDENLDYLKNFVSLASGSAQTILEGDQSIVVADSNAYLTVQGNLLTGYGGLRTETVQGILNQKIYNGAKSIYDAPSNRTYNKLVTTYEYQAVAEQSFSSNTVVHFGDRKIYRRGNQTETITGATSATTYGNTTEQVYGDSVEVIVGARLVSMDHVINIVNVIGLNLAVAMGFTVTALLGMEFTYGLLSLVFQTREQLAGLIKGDIQGTMLKTAVAKLENIPVAGTVLGVCLRGIAGVFGVIRV